MKLPLALAAIAILTAQAFAQNEPPPAESGSTAPAQPSLHPDLEALIKTVKEKLTAEGPSADLSGELTKFDELIAKLDQEGDKDNAAQATLLKGMLYLQVKEDPEKASETISEIPKKYPDTQLAQAADRILASINAQKEAMAKQAALKEGAEFPNFEVTDLDGKPLSIAAAKGKVVLVDFWATWCGPCVNELPNVIAAYNKYHDKGFEIIGISLDQDKAALTDFIKKHEMPWPQFFDGKGWQNELAEEYGINSIPATFLLDKDGKIIGKGLRGPALDAAIAKAVGAEG